MLLKTFSIFYFQFNFVGRILGPRGMTAKHLEQDTGCKIMVRGKGSMRDKAKVRGDHRSCLYTGSKLYMCFMAILSDFSQGTLDQILMVYI